MYYFPADDTTLLSAPLPIEMICKESINHCILYFKDDSFTGRIPCRKQTSF